MVVFSTIRSTLLLSNSVTHPASLSLFTHTHTHSHSHAQTEHTHTLVHIQFAGPSITINPYKFPLYIQRAKRNDSNKNFQMQTKQILINEKLQLKKKQCNATLSLALSLSRSNPGLLQLFAIFHYAEAQNCKKKSAKMQSKCCLVNA